MACPLDLWVHGLGQYKAFTSLCIPQHQAEVSDCADKGISGSTAKRLNESYQTCTLSQSQTIAHQSSIVFFFIIYLLKQAKLKGTTCTVYTVKDTFSTGFLMFSNRH